MKKVYILLVLFSINFVKAQVPNGDFEEVIGYGNDTRFWGPIPIFQLAIFDPDGNVIPETIIFDDENVASICFYTSNAQSGSRAMEIRNAFNVTRNEVIPGKMILFNENEGSIVPTGWNTGFPIESNMNIELLGFHYKFFPIISTDVAQAKLEVFNENNELMNEALIEISGNHSEYTYIYAPHQILTIGTPTFVTVEFKMGTDSNPTHFGSRLIIDNVITNFGSLAIDSNEINTDFSVFPTLVDSEISILPANNAVGLVNYKIINTQGRLVKQTNQDTSSNYVYSMNVSDLASGIYFLEIEYNSQKIIKKFVKK